jgi:glycosyltransferase involved in cell wall biosynthesis
LRILCFIDCLGAGGAQRQMVELAMGFKERGHQVAFLTYHHLPFFNPLLDKEGIDITLIHEDNYLRRAFKIRRFIRRGNYDAVLSFLEGSNFMGEFAGIPYRKWKLVVGERSANPGILQSLTMKVYRWFHYFADAIVANSSANMELVRSANPLLPVSKCHIIYNIIDFKRFQPCNNHVYKKDLKISVVIAARIRPEKNIGRLIEALAMLSKEERQQIRINWYGSYNHEIRSNSLLTDAVEQIREKGLEGVLAFHEATHNIVKHIQESDAVGLFSTYEGFPNCICEAMACEKPVICTRISDMTGLLSHEPRLLCDPLDPHSIRQSLSYLIHLEPAQLKRIGSENRKIALEKFKKEDIVSAYLRLLGNGKVSE